MVFLVAFLYLGKLKCVGYSEILISEIKRNLVSMTSSSFLATTKVALPQEHHQALAERARRDDEWELEDLEEAEKTGEG